MGLLCQPFLPDRLGGDAGPERTALPHGSGKAFKGLLLRGRMVVDGRDKGCLALLQGLLLPACAILTGPEAVQLLFQPVQAGRQGQGLVPVAEQPLRPGKIVFIQVQRRAGAAKSFPGPLLPPLPAGEIVLFFLPALQQASQALLLVAVQRRLAVGQGRKALQLRLTGLLRLCQRGGGLVFPPAGHLQGRRAGRQRGGLPFQRLPAEDRAVRGPDAGAVPAGAQTGKPFLQTAAELFLAQVCQRQVGQGLPVGGALFRQGAQAGQGRRKGLIRAQFPELSARPGALFLQALQGTPVILLPFPQAGQTLASLRREILRQAGKTLQPHPQQMPLPPLFPDGKAPLRTAQAGLQLRLAAAEALQILFALLPPGAQVIVAAAPGVGLTDAGPQLLPAPRLDVEGQLAALRAIDGIGLLLQRAQHIGRGAQARAEAGPVEGVTHGLVVQALEALQFPQAEAEHIAVDLTVDAPKELFQQAVRHRGAVRAGELQTAAARARAAMQVQQAVGAAFQYQAAPGLAAAQGLAGLPFLAPGGIAGEHGPQEGQTGGFAGFVVAQKNVDARTEALGARSGEDAETVRME